MTALFQLLKKTHLDASLCLLLGMLASIGLTILYGASNKNLALVESQLLHLLLAWGVLCVMAQLSPMTLQRYSLWIYLANCLLLVLVLIIGHIGKGAERWLHLGILHIQPAELIKLTLPLCLANYYHHRALPITLSSTLTAVPFILIPALLIVKQPDLGTAILVIASGMSVLFLAGLSFRLIGYAAGAVTVSLPLFWYHLHDYQKQRVLTFFNPERDPLGAGYHIIQSKIAIGSGGLWGKGFLQGTQSTLHFLPEHTTDFIFAVWGEEWGWIGCFMLLTLFALIIWRGLIITRDAQNTFTRLLAGSLTTIFFISFFINISMVVGLLPVVGIPLPLISYGGSSIVTTMASFGMLMSIQTHRQLITT